MQHLDLAPERPESTTRPRRAERTRVWLCCAAELYALVSEMARPLEDLGHKAQALRYREVRAALPRRTPSPALHVFVLCLRDAYEERRLARLRKLIETRGGPSTYALSLPLDLTRPLTLVPEIQRFIRALERRATAGSGSATEAMNSFEHMRTRPYCPLEDEGSRTRIGGRMALERPVSTSTAFGAAVTASRRSTSISWLFAAVGAGVLGTSAYVGLGHDSTPEPRVTAAHLASPPPSPEREAPPPTREPPPRAPASLDAAPSPTAPDLPDEADAARALEQHAPDAAVFATAGVPWASARASCHTGVALAGTWRLPTRNQLRRLHRLGKLPAGTYWSRSHGDRRAWVYDTTTEAFSLRDLRHDAAVVCVVLPPKSRDGGAT